MGKLAFNSDEKVTKYVLFTFDYELYLGVDSGDVYKSLIRTTNRLLDLLKENNFKGIFFIDTVYLCRLKEILSQYPSAQKDYQLITDQIRRMADEGHEVFPHIHAHWQDAVYNAETNRWVLTDYSKYSFSNLDDKLQNELFASSVNILKEILSGRNVSLDGYRAGGWSIQPFKSFLPFFSGYKIAHEFSVIPGKSLKSDSNWFDFSQCPGKEVYRFHEEVTKENAEGKFTQYSISVTEIPRWLSYISNKFNILLFEMKMKFAWPAGDGKVIHLKNLTTKDIHENAGRRLLASFENFNPFITRYQVADLKKRDYLHFISHPKILSPMNLYYTGFFMKKIRRKFWVETDFRKINVSRLAPLFWMRHVRLQSIMSPSGIFLMIFLLLLFFVTGQSVEMDAKTP